MLGLKFRPLSAAFWVAAICTGLTSAQAQVGTDSDWSTADGDLRIYANASTLYPRDNWRSGMGARRDAGSLAYVEMQGSYRNLRWQGEYWIMGAEDGWRPSAAEGSYRPSGACAATRPNGYRPGDDADDYGEFDITFNAAENAFTGQKRWICRYPDGRARKGAWQPFNGARKGLVAQMQNSVAVPTGTVTTTPSGGTTPAPGGRTPREQREWDYRQCTYQLDIISLDIAQPDGSRRNTRFVRDFQIRPCTIDAAAFEKFQIDMLSPPADKRPAQLFLRSIQIEGIPGPSVDRNIRVPVRFLNPTISINLPFTGVPRPGSAIMNQIMPGRFCSAALWAAYMRYSDGTESAPFSVIISACGARNHPEQLPDTASGSEAPRVEDLKPRVRD